MMMTMITLVTMTMTMTMTMTIMLVLILTLPQVMNKIEAGKSEPRAVREVSIGTKTAP